MKKAVFTKAKARVQTAHKSFARLLECRTFADYSDEWYVFLCAWKNVFTILEQASKDSDVSKSWFEKMCSERRADDLLNYMYEARNDNEHGVENVIEQKQALQINIPIVAGATFKVRMKKDDDGDTASVVGLYSTTTVYPEVHDTRFVTLKNVSGRKGRKFSPPTMHLGEKLHDNSPNHVASLGLRYINSVVDAAEKLIREPNP